MAIGYMHIEWLSSLALRSQIPAGAAVLDLGTSDLWAEPAPLRRIAARHLAPAECDRIMAAIFDGGTPRRRCQQDFYSIFGAGSYRSIDFGDERADFSLDLNLPVPADTGTYDVVTNFGTTEHIFNVSQSFANIHTLLKVGGLQLHTLPSYGAIDHGFYNFHPCFYLDLARANAYDVVDVLYIDNINVRMARPIQTEPFDFATLPIQRRDMADTNALMTKVVRRFQENLQSAETQTVLEALVPRRRRLLAAIMKPAPLPIFLMFDMMFVALRKTKHSPAEFVTPMQGVYAAKPPEAKSGFLRRLFRRT
jgi:hypothetical protein